MRSATSYCNGTLYRKTLARFWPLWGLYSLIWLFVLPLNLLTTYFNSYHNMVPNASRYLSLRSIAWDIPYVLEWGMMTAAFFAILSAMAVFGYLYSSRSVRSELM